MLVARMGLSNVDMSISPDTLLDIFDVQSVLR